MLFADSESLKPKRQPGKVYTHIQQRNYVNFNANIYEPYKCVGKPFTPHDPIWFYKEKDPDTGNVVRTTIKN